MNINACDVGTIVLRVLSPPRRCGASLTTKNSQRFTQNFNPTRVAKGKRFGKQWKRKATVLMTLSERIGDTFARQAFSVKDLMDRWNCSETCVRKVVKSHRLKLLRGPNGKCFAGRMASRVLLLRCLEVQFWSTRTETQCCLYRGGGQNPRLLGRKGPISPHLKFLSATPRREFANSEKSKCKLKQVKSHAHKSA